MTYEFQCGVGHVTEVFSKTFSDVEVVVCSVCGGEAKRIFSAPLGFGLYGDPRGFYKPSATKRYSTKTVSQKEGNKNAVG